MVQFVNIKERLPINPNLWVLVTNEEGMFSMGRWNGKKWEIRNCAAFGLPHNENSSTLAPDQITYWVDSST